MGRTRPTSIRLALMVTVNTFLALAAMSSTASAATLYSSRPEISSSPPPYPCWGDPAGQCSAWVGKNAAAYADEYAINPNSGTYPVYGEDCTNFVSQALYAGGQSMIAPTGGPYGTVVVDDDYQWWWAVVSRGDGRTASWSVADDLWKFENLDVSPNVLRDAYGQYWDWGQVNGAPDTAGAFLPNTELHSQNVPPTDLNNTLLPLSKGDIFFYNWDYTGDKYGNGFFGNHDSILVSKSGTDPKSDWIGPLIDEHTTNRYHAIWNLIPYNSQAATTAAWWDTWYPGVPPDQTGAPWRAMNYTPRNAPVNRDAQAPTVRPGSVPALTTPSTLLAQRAYSGRSRIEGDLSVPEITAAEQAFQGAMVERQQLDVPPLAQITLTARQPTAMALDDMGVIGSRRISALFTGAALQAERTTLKNAQDWEATSDVRALAGGADHFHYALIRAISPTQVEIRGTVRTWAKVAQVQVGGRVVPAVPSNILDVKVTMTRSASGWKISSRSWAFAPGSQP
jgi:hypothetical protein